jgi:hypothetical protein
MPIDSDEDFQIDVALGYMQEAERSRAVSTATVGDEWSAVIALRATSLTDYVCGLNLVIAERQRERAARYLLEAERRRPSGRRVHSVAESEALHDDAGRCLQKAIRAENAALSMIDASDLAAANRALAHLGLAEAVASSGALHEWRTAVDMTPRLRAWRAKRQRGLFVRGRAEQASQPPGGLLPLARFNRYELGGVALKRQTESGNAGTIGSAVELIARWDIALDPRATGDPLAAALEAIRGVRHGEHNSSIFARLAAAQRAREWTADEFEEAEWTAGDGDETLSHIAEMRTRVARCFERFGRPVRPGTWAVNSARFHLDGHIDFVAVDTLWDLKVSGTAPSASDVLQLLLYWLTFSEDQDNELDIAYLGIYNPRVDTVWRISVVDIPEDVMSALEAIALGEYSRL